MALLKSRDFRADSGKRLPSGTHRPPLGGSTTCWILFFPSVAVSEDEASFFFFTNSKNSATCRAYLESNKMNYVNQKLAIVSRTPHGSCQHKKNIQTQPSSLTPIYKLLL